MRTKKDKEREKYIYWITKKKVINLYIKYGLRITPIISKIDYPVRDILKKWYNNFIINNKKLSFLSIFSLLMIKNYHSYHKNSVSIIKSKLLSQSEW